MPMMGKVRSIREVLEKVKSYYPLCKPGEQRVPFKKSEASNLKRMAAKISGKLLKIVKQCSGARNLHLRRDYSNCSLENGINESE